MLPVVGTAPKWSSGRPGLNFATGCATTGCGVSMHDHSNGRYDFVPELFTSCRQTNRGMRLLMHTITPTKCSVWTALDFTLRVIWSNQQSQPTASSTLCSTQALNESIFIRLALVASRTHQITRNSDKRPYPSYQGQGQGYSRSSILVSTESSHATS